MQLSDILFINFVSCLKQNFISFPAETRPKTKSQVSSVLVCPWLRFPSLYLCMVTDFCGVGTEGEESWMTNQGLYLSISIMSIPCLSPHTPQGLAPNTR